MKTLLLIALMIFPSMLFAQSDTTQYNLPYVSGGVVYEKTLDRPGFSKLEIFGASKKWIADTFNNGKSVIQFEDKDQGRIIGKASTTVTTNGGTWGLVTSTNLEFKLQIDCKDNKYRIRLYDIIQISPSYSVVSNVSLESLDEKSRGFKNKKRLELWNSHVKSINSEFYSLALSLDMVIINAKSDAF